MWFCKGLHWITLSWAKSDVVPQFMHLSVKLMSVYEPNRVRLRVQPASTNLKIYIGTTFAENEI